jgi:hypothetical protein
MLPNSKRASSMECESSETSQTYKKSKPRYYQSFFGIVDVVFGRL